MRLLARHIARSIRRSPIQPLLICLIVMLSVALSATAFRLSGMFATHSRQESAVNEQLGDLLITARGDSASRLLFTEEAEAVLGESGEVLGDFRLTGFLMDGEKKTALDISAVDLLAADDFYRFSYIEYGRFTTQNIKTSAILSKSAAKAAGLGVGDRFTLRLLEIELTYTVEAVAEDSGLLAQSDVLIQIDGILQLLAERVPIVAAMGDSFLPYTRLMVRLEDPADTDAVLAHLNASPSFSDKTVSETAKLEQVDFLVLLQLVFVWVFMLLLLLLSGFLIGTSLTLLHRRRSADYALFVSVGATARQITALLYIESAVYALVGGVGGVLLAIPAVRAAGSFYSWWSEPLELGVFGVLFGLLMAPCLMGACTALHVRRQKKEAEAGQELDEAGLHVGALALAEWLPPAGIILLALLLLLILPASLGYIAAIAGIVALAWLLFAAFPTILKQLAALSESLFEKAGMASGWLLLAVKNIRHRFAMRHAGRLVALFGALILTIMTCEQVLSAQINMMTKKLPIDFLAYNVSEETRERIHADPAVAGVVSMTYITGVEMPNGASGIAVSLEGDIEQCMPQELLPERLPQGREIFLSVGLAALTEATVGEAVTLVIEGNPYEFVVAGTLAINGNFFYFDSDVIGYDRDMFGVRLTASDATEVERLSAELEAQGCLVAEAEAAFGIVPQTLGGHLKLMRYAVYAALLLGGLGCINVFSQQYRGRQRERRVLRSCGMTRGGLIVLYLTEALLVLVPALLSAGLTGGLMILLIDRGMRSFGMVLFL